MSTQGFVTQDRAVLGSGAATAAGAVPLVTPGSFVGSAEQGLPWGSARPGHRADVGLPGESCFWGVWLQISSSVMPLWLVLRSSWVAPLGG